MSKTFLDCIMQQARSFSLVIFFIIIGRLIRLFLINYYPNYYLVKIFIWSFTPMIDISFIWVMVLIGLSFFILGCIMYISTGLRKMH